jgi:glycosyltransferase involved in cell wall biosynthesis
MQFVSRLPGMHVIASNRDTKHKLKRWVSSTFWDDITVAHAAFDPVQIDAARLTREDAREIRVRHDIPLDKAVVLAVGNFVDRKGRWVFLEAAAQLLKTESDLFFVWLTPQLPGDADRAQVESFGINDSLKIIRSESLGKDRMDVLRFFNIADIFALPSYIEGLPISLLEAMAIGVASISTRVFAIPEAIEHMRTGLLIDAGRSDQLADSILMLKNDIELRRRLAAAGRSFVTENFDERESARKCIAAFKECFADGR